MADELFEDYKKNPTIEKRNALVEKNPREEARNINDSPHALRRDPGLCNRFGHHRSEHRRGGSPTLPQRARSTVMRGLRRGRRPRHCGVPGPAGGDDSVALPSMSQSNGSESVTEPLTVADVVALLQAAAPPGLAEDWDSNGLICGDPAEPVRTVLLAVDPLTAVVDEAIGRGVDMVITHHPLYADFIMTEHPQTIALILAHMDSTSAAETLSYFNDELRSEVVVRMANLGDISPSIIKRVSTVLEGKLESLTSYKVEVGGPRAVAEVLNRLGQKASKATIE